MSGRRSALIVAIQRYADPGLSALQAPDADAAELSAVLADPDIGDFEVTTVVDAPSHEVNVAVASLFRDRRADDLLLLHFSCHGVKDDSGELYFATADTRLDLLDATAVASSFVNRVMDRSRAGRVLLLLDCCYAGAFARGMTARAAGPVDIGDRLGGRGRAVIAASSALQFAFEGSSLADAATRAPSAFTSALVQGLRSGDADRDLDGWVSLDELYAYVHDEVTHANPDQTPKKWAFDIEGDLYVARRGRPVATPSELPEQIRRTMGSLMTWERASAVQPLHDLMDGDHPGLALAARLALERMSTRDDSVQVRQAAGHALRDAPVGAAPPPVDEPVVPGPQARPGADSLPYAAPERQAIPAAHERRVRRPALVVAGLVVAVLAVVAGWVWWPFGGGPPNPPGPFPATLAASEMLLTQSNGGPDEIVAYDVAADSGGTRSVLTDPSATLPTISPDREEMVYLAGTDAAGQTPYVARVNGQDVHPLLTGRAATACPTSGRPAWDPRGVRLALVCTVDGDHRLVTVAADGTQLTRLPAAVRPVGAPTWLDGHTVVYESAGPTAGAPHTLRSLRISGPTDAAVLTDGSQGSDTQPDVTRAGLVFLRKSAPTSPGGDIWLRTAAGVERQVTRRGDATWPAPSPDGTTLVWLQGPPGSQVVLRRALDGGHPVALRIAGTPGPPAWDSR